MAAAATFRHGDPVMVDYTAGANITAGDFVAIGSLMGIAHVDIANGTLGALALGGGVYDCAVASNYAAGTKIYKAAGNTILTNTATNNALVGFTVEAAAAANAVVKVLHMPNA